MASTSLALGPQMYRCSFPGCPVPVSVHISLIETLEAIARFEVGDQQGILYGQAAEGGTIVRSSRALTVFRMEQMRGAIFEAREPVAGYYRIREGNSLELNAEEIQLAETMFAKPGSVILLIERRGGSPKANFFFLEDGKFMNFPLLDFPLDSATLIEREAQRTRRQEAVIVDVASLQPPSNSPAPVVDVPPASARPSAWRLSTLVLAIIATVASLFAIVLLYRSTHRSGSAGAAVTTPAQSRSPLRAERQGDDLKISWDLNSPAIAAATSGVLDIDDGGTPRRILMTADQVRFGSVLYSPAAEQISVRLTTLKDDQSTDQQSVLVLLRRSPQPAGQPNARVPFEVKKTERVPANHAFVPLGLKHEVKPVEAPAVPRAEPPASLPVASAAPAPDTVSPRSEAPKPVVETKPERVEPPAPVPMVAASPTPVVATPKSDPPKPAVETKAERVEHIDAPAPQPVKSAPTTPITTVPRNEPVKPQTERYVPAVLVTQEGVRPPRELLPILRPTTVSVRVDVNETGRVVRAEAIPEKGIHNMLLSAAVDAARRCRFQPARRGQSPVASTVIMVFHVDPKKE